MSCETSKGFNLWRGEFWGTPQELKDKQKNIWPYIISLLNSPLFVATNAPFSDSPAFGLWKDTQQAPFSVVLGRVQLLGNPGFFHVFPTSAQERRTPMAVAKDIITNVLRTSLLRFIKDASGDQWPGY